MNAIEQQIEVLKAATAKAGRSKEAALDFLRSAGIILKPATHHEAIASPNALAK